MGCRCAEIPLREQDAGTLANLQSMVGLTAETFARCQSAKSAIAANILAAVETDVTAGIHGHGNAEAGKMSRCRTDIGWAQSRLNAKTADLRREDAAHHAAEYYAWIASITRKK
jgi:hypothetical protein